MAGRTPMALAVLGVGVAALALGAMLTGGLDRSADADVPPIDLTGQRVTPETAPDGPARSETPDVVIPVPPQVGESGELPGASPSDDSNAADEGGNADDGEADDGDDEGEGKDGDDD